MKRRGGKTSLRKPNRAGDVASPRAVVSLDLPAWLRTLQAESTRLEFPMGGRVRVAVRWGAPPRRLVEHLFYFVLDESFMLRTGGREYRIGPGTLLWMPPFFSHEMWLPENQRPFSLYWFRLRVNARIGGQSRQATPSMPPPGFVLAEDALHLRPYLQTIVEEMRSPDSIARERVRAALVLLASSVLRGRASPSAAGIALFNDSQRRHLREFVSNRVRERLTPPVLARELRLSHDYFSRVFRRSFGVSCKTWLMRERIQHAAQRLASSLLTVSEVAYEYGYPDVFLFSRQFKQVMGAGPKDWRRRSAV